MYHSNPNAPATTPTPAATPTSPLTPTAPQVATPAAQAPQITTQTQPQPKKNLSLTVSTSSWGAFLVYCRNPYPPMDIKPIVSCTLSLSDADIADGYWFWRPCNYMIMQK